MKTVIFSDRDGTINEDKNYYLGSKPYWKQQVSFLETVVEGIRLINTIPNSEFYILTNQSGVALGGEEFEQLNVERMDEVNDYIIKELKSQGCKVKGYFACPFVDSKYAEKAKQKGRKVMPNFIYDNHPDLKPNTGMIVKAVDDEKCKIYMIGDRASDVEMGLKAGGHGILIESLKTKELGDVRQVLEMGIKAHVVKDYLAAAQLSKQLGTSD